MKNLINVLCISVFNILESITTPNHDCSPEALVGCVQEVILPASSCRGGSLHLSLTSASCCEAAGGGGLVRQTLEVSYKVYVFFTALELDKNRVIETAPLSFRTLLGVLGIEAALDSLIKLLCGGTASFRQDNMQE